VVKTDPNSQPGWLWLGKYVRHPDQNKYCFERVLGLDPNNQEALLSLKGIPSHEETYSLENLPDALNPRGPTPFPAGSLASSLLPQPTFTPFITDNEEELITVVVQGAESREIQSPSPAQQEIKFVARDYKEPVRPQKKKKNPALKSLLWFLPVILLCLVGVGYLVLSDKWMIYLPPGLFSFPLPNSALRVGLVIPTDNLVYRQFPIATPTFIKPTVILSPTPYHPLFRNI
jgi:hypothetical protein